MVQKITKSKLELPVWDIKGQEIERYVLSKKCFAAYAKPELLAQAVRVYLANQRKAWPKTKTRGEIRGSRRKIWSQKGTGRARHGDYYAPIFVGGGRAHGPTGNQSYQLNFPRKMRNKALLGALSEKAENEKIKLVTGLKNLKPKTKEAEMALTKIVGKDFGKNSKYLLVLLANEELTKRAFSNLPYVKTILVENLNSYFVLNSDLIIFTKDALEKLENRFKKNEK